MRNQDVAASPAEDVLSIENICVEFSAKNGRQLKAVDDVSLQVKEHEFVALIGPSGCGKSTILNAAAGLIPTLSGSIRINGKPSSGISNDIGYISQMDSLLPWKSVLDNIALGLELRGVKKKERRERARELVEQMGLGGFEDSYPHELSGGMKKRVTIARVLAIDPKILFMDEPFGPLDAFTKEKLQDDILRIWQDSRQTIMYVTHDLSEAITLADRVVLVSARPARIKREYAIGLPRPRKVMDIKFDERFVELERMIWSDLRQEINRSTEEDWDEKI